MKKALSVLFVILFVFCVIASIIVFMSTIPELHANGGKEQGTFNLSTPDACYCPDTPRWCWCN